MSPKVVAAGSPNTRVRRVAERIGIIGGGFSGLLSAYFLERMFEDRIDIVVLEASDRLGGRVKSATDCDTGVTYEAGAAEFYDIQFNPQLRALIDHLGLQTRPLLATPHFVVSDRVVRDDGGLADLVGLRGIDKLRRFWERGTALRPPEEYALAGQETDNGHPWLRPTFSEVLSGIDDTYCEWFTAMQCHSDLATEPALTSGLFGMDNLLIDHPGYCSMYTLAAGNEGLIRALSERVRSPILLHTPVRQVEATENAGLRIRFQSSVGESNEVEVDGVIVTLPPRGLRMIRWLDNQLRIAVSDHVRHHDYSTDYLRVTLFCRQKVWRHQFPEDYFVSDAFGGVTIYDQSPDDGTSGVGVQSWLLAGASAREQAGRADADVVKSVLAAMPASIPFTEDLLIRSFVDRWTGMAGVSAKPGGVPLRPLTQRHSPDARWPQLQFVGDYLYDSTLCGALDAVAFAVNRLGDDVARRTGPALTTIGDLLAAPSRDTSSSLSASFFLDAARSL